MSTSEHSQMHASLLPLPKCGTSNINQASFYISSQTNLKTDAAKETRSWLIYQWNSSCIPFYKPYQHAKLCGTWAGSLRSNRISEIEKLI